VLGFDPARLASPSRAHKDGLHIVVSMGGADPLGLTDLAVEAVRGVSYDLRADFIIGPAFADPEALAARIAKASPHFRALKNVPDLASVFAGADLAVIAFGVTAYELAALGVPAIYLPISADHARSASVFASAGLGVALPQNEPAANIAAAVTNLMENEKQRHAMRLAGPRIMDGKGALRIAADLAAVLA
jgi:spore coat polysaccharide biosynthesis protein SpsF